MATKKADSYSSGEEDIPLFKRGARLSSHANSREGEGGWKETPTPKTPARTPAQKQGSSSRPPPKHHASSNGKPHGNSKKALADRLPFRETEIRPQALTPETYKPSILEPCMVGQAMCNLPFEIFNLPDLSSILSMDTWKNVLTEDERAPLLQYLPSSSDIDFDSALEELFSCANLNFGSPLFHFSLQLRSGLYHPNVACYLQGLKLFQQRQHYHFVRQYHNSMVNSWLDMKKLWQAFPEADLNTKLQEWKSLKEGKLKPFPRPIKESVRPLPSAEKDASPLVNTANHEQKSESHKTDAPGKHALNLSIPKRKRSGIESSTANAVQQPPTKKASSETPNPPAKEPSDTSEPTESKKPTQPTGQSHPTKTFSALHVLSSVRAALLRDKNTEGIHWVSLADIVNYVQKNPGEPRVLRAKEGIPLLTKTALRVLHSKAPPGTRLWKPFVQQRKAGQEWAWCGPVPSEEVASRRCQVDAIAWGLSSKALSKLRERFREILSSAINPEVPVKTPLPKTEPSEKGFKSPKGESKRNSTVAHPKDVVDRVKSEPPLHTNEAEEKGRRDSPRKASINTSAPSPVAPSSNAPSSTPPSPSPSAGTPSRNVDEASAPVSEEVDIMDSLSEDMEDAKDPSELVFSPYSLKGQVTLPPITYELRRLFRKEEKARYANPEKSFYYTAVDGSKSMVAPVKRFVSKSSVKARDHAMLKTNRPPHVTVLCLVRDSAARLPNGFGTRADVSVLIRDSQYFVEDTPDVQVNQIVSGALDRLHYERDPCIKFDPERKLWVYLHKYRRPSDFALDGTKSARAWHRKKNSVGNGNENVGSGSGGSGSGSGIGENGKPSKDTNEHLENDTSTDGNHSHSPSGKSKESKDEEEIDVGDERADFGGVQVEEYTAKVDDDKPMEKKRKSREISSEEKHSSSSMKEYQMEKKDEEMEVYSAYSEDNGRAQVRDGIDGCNQADLERDVRLMDFEEEIETNHSKKKRSTQLDYDSGQSINSLNNIRILRDVNNTESENDRADGMLEPYGHIPPSQFFGGSNLILPSKKSTISRPLSLVNWRGENAKNHHKNGFHPSTAASNGFNGDIHSHFPNDTMIQTNVNKVSDYNHQLSDSSI